MEIKETEIYKWIISWLPTDKEIKEVDKKISECEPLSNN